MSNGPRKSIAVVGGGITGLTAAFRLQERGHAVTVFERGDSVGGAVGSIRENGYLIEKGPNTLQSGSPEVRRLVRDLGLDAQVVVASPLAQKRYVVRGGRLLPFPTSPGKFITTRLFSLRTKLALLSDLLTRQRMRTTDLALGELMRSHFSREFVDYAVNPFVAGVYAGDPEKLSAKHAFPMVWEAERSHGSIIRGVMAAVKKRRAVADAGAITIVSFPDGLQTLTDALAARVGAGSIRTGATVETLIPGRPHRVIWREHGRDLSTGEFDAVILAVPASSLAHLAFGTLGERPLAGLDGIPHPPVSSLFLGFRREQISHPLDGFGLLVPAVAGRDISGVLFSSTLFPGRAPEGHVALTVFAGGTRQPEMARLATPQLRERVMGDLRDLLGVVGEPEFVRHTTWPRAIPQYVLGYERWLEAMTNVEKTHTGVLVGGQVRDGISLPACIASGEKLAARVGEVR
ncbi:MAG TPA: protoporphyrinogen oxidase [Candidatus Didemnitutus sp.]|nr:protoporphyrinogen oxidase [Candidatus Didemnitutus sp.]